MAQRRVVCLDVDGTLTDGVGGPTLEGAVAAVERLRAHFPVRLVTNSTSRAHGELVRRLLEQGLLDAAEHLFTPAAVARKVLPARRHDRGILLVAGAAAEDYAWFRESSEDPAAVVLATEAHDRTIEDLQPAFRALLGGAAFYALQQNRYYRRGQELVTDLGPVVALLSYASGRPAETLGKPSPLLFDAIARELSVERRDLVMVGDDAEFDVAGAVRLGMTGILVRTGKYRPGDEGAVSPLPSYTIDSIVALPELLLG